MPGVFEIVHEAFFNDVLDIANFFTTLLSIIGIIYLYLQLRSLPILNTCNKIVLMLTVGDSIYVVGNIFTSFSNVNPDICTFSGPFITFGIYISAISCFMLAYLSY